MEFRFVESLDSNPSQPPAPEDINHKLECGPMYGFGYDAINDDYNVVIVYQSWDKVSSSGDYFTEIKLYSWKDNCWSTFYDTNKFHFLRELDEGDNYNSIPFNNALHWLAVSSGSHNQLAMVSYEKFHRDAMPLPIDVGEGFSDLEGNYVGELRLADLKGCLHFIVIGGKEVDIWIMKDNFRVKDSWFKLYSLLKKDNFANGLSNPQIITYSKRMNNVIVHYDEKGGQVKVVNLLTGEEERVFFYYKVICERHGKIMQTYVESLVNLKEEANSESKSNTRCKKRQRREWQLEQNGEGDDEDDNTQRNAKRPRDRVREEYLEAEIERLQKCVQMKEDELIRKDMSIEEEAQKRYAQLRARFGSEVRHKLDRVREILDFTPSTSPRASSTSSESSF